MLLAECVKNCTFLRSYVGLLHDWPHIAFELTLEVITGALGFLFGRLALRRHDRKVHGA